MRTKSLGSLTQATRVTAANFGVSVTSLLQAKAVVEAGDSEPSRYGGLLEALDPRCVEAVRFLQARFDEPVVAPPVQVAAPLQPAPVPAASKRVRGLSKRQRDILLQAQLAHRRRNGGPGHEVDLYYREIYEYETTHVLQTSASRPNTGDFDARRDRLAPKCPRYTSVVNSIGRSVRSLEERGLVTRVKGSHAQPAGLDLTEVGAAVAEELQRLC